MQVYNLKPDEKTHRSDATFEYVVRKGDQQIFKHTETSAEMKQTGDQVTVERMLPLATFAPGKYTLEVSAKDALTNQSITRTAEFTVKEAAVTKSASNSAPGR